MKVRLNNAYASDNLVTGSFIKLLTSEMEYRTSPKWGKFAAMFVRKGKMDTEFKDMNSFVIEVNAFTKDMVDVLCAYAESINTDVLDIMFRFTTEIGTFNVALEYSFDSNFKGGLVSIVNLDDTVSKHPIFVKDFDL